MTEEKAALYTVASPVMEESKQASPSVASPVMEDKRSDEEMWKADPAANMGNGGIVLVLFETPSGFALFNYDGIKLFLPNAIQNIWGEFVMEFMEAVWLKDFKTFEDKASVLNHHTGVDKDLECMIRNNLDPHQKLVVGKKEYKIIIEKSLDITCIYNDEVMELMWGIRNQMQYLLPDEKLKVTEEDRFPICEGMRHVLDRYKFDVKPEMVSKSIIEATGLVFECDYNVNKHAVNMHYAGEHLKKISGIDVKDWDLLKLATALMIVSYPKGEQIVAGNLEKLFGNDYPTLLKDAPKYKDKLREVACFRVYKEMLWARKIRHKALGRLEALIRRANEEYEAEQAMRNMSDPRSLC